MPEAISPRQAHGPLDGALVDESQLEAPSPSALENSPLNTPHSAPTPSGSITWRRTVARRLSPGEMGPTWLRGDGVDWSAAVEVSPLTSCSLLERPRRAGIQDIIVELQGKMDFIKRYLATTVMGPPGREYLSFLSGERICKAHTSSRP